MMNCDRFSLTVFSSQIYLLGPIEYNAVTIYDVYMQHYSYFGHWIVKRKKEKIRTIIRRTSEKK